MQQKNSKEIITNTAYTMGGALLMNGVLQIAVYPLLNRSMGAGRLGSLLYIMGLVAIVCPSVGQALNTSRLVVRRDVPVINGDYNRMLLLFGALGCAASIVLTLLISRSSMDSAVSGGLTVLLIMATIFRYYGDVEYRLNLNYRRYFIYYAVLTAGYLAGYGFYRLTGNWFFIFLTGEIAALAYVGVSGSIFKDFFRKSPWFGTAFRRGGVLLFSYLITNLTLNLDRLVLQSMLGGTAVTQYYVTSLIGKTMVLLVAPVNTIVISYLTKSKENLNRKQFALFAGAGGGVSLLFFLAAQIGTPLFIRIFYGQEMYRNVKGMITVVNLTQILGLFSAYLFIVVLTFTEEKWQFLLQTAHLGLTVALVLIFTKNHAIIGFATSVFIANILRVLAVLTLGFIKANEKTGEDH